MKTFNRRSFLKASAVAAASLGWSARSWSQVAGSNDDIRVAVIGFNGRGRAHINDLLQVKGARIVALCDVDQAVLARETSRLAGLGHTVKTYTDLRRLLESREIDAVTTATPNHWHSLLTIWACQAGKDVYVEKPVSHNVWEGRKMVEAARKYNRIVQTGTQSRSDTGLQEAVAWVKAGNLGRITLSRGLCYKRRESIGRVDGPQLVPDSIDYNLWTGPAELQPLMRSRLHYDWHWVFTTGNGDLGNQGIHQMDIARWFLGENELSPRVFSVGGRLGYVDDGDTPNTQFVHFAYARAPLVFEVRGLPATANRPEMNSFLGVSVGNVIHCENGFVTVAGAGDPVVVHDRDGRVVKTFQGARPNHQIGFIQAVRSRRISDLTADILEGHVSSALCHVGNISHQVGRLAPQGEIRERITGDRDAADAFDRMIDHLAANRVDLNRDRLTFGEMLSVDTKSERFINNGRANALLSRNYRAPFVVPERV